jgi:hypothetical protein
MIVNGGINYDSTGRRKKTKSARSYRRFGGNGSNSIPDYSYRPSRASAVKSLDTRECSTTVSAESKVKQEISQNYTVAVAYNKGAYQVIPKDSVKLIGK